MSLGLQNVRVLAACGPGSIPGQPLIWPERELSPQAALPLRQTVQRRLRGGASSDREPEEHPVPVTGSQSSR